MQWCSYNELLNKTSNKCNEKRIKTLLQLSINELKNGTSYVFVITASNVYQSSGKASRLIYKTYKTSGKFILRASHVISTLIPLDQAFSPLLPYDVEEYALGTKMTWVFAVLATLFSENFCFDKNKNTLVRMSEVKFA